MQHVLLKVVMKMATVKLQMSSVDVNDNRIITNVGYINPSATDADIKLFAQKLMAFSNNSLTNVYKVITDDITDVEVNE